MLKQIWQSFSWLQNGSQPVSQQCNGLSGYGGGGSYTQCIAGTWNSGPPSDNEIRLALQGVADDGGAASSFPSSVSAAIWHAVQSGWLDDGRGEMIEATANGQCGGGGGGFTTFRITESGRKKLAELTAACPNPTRLVHQQRYIPGAGVVAYGAPIEQPLNKQFSLKDGCLVAPYR